MNPSLSQTIPFPAGIGFTVVCVGGDSVVVEALGGLVVDCNNVEFVVA